MKFVPFDKPVEERETLLKEDQEKKMRFVPFSPEEQERVKMKSLEQAWSEAAAINPDEEAEAIRLAEANGWPLWMVKRKPENKKLAKANVEMPDWAKLSKDYPKTANFLGIPRNMALSKDDVESLKKIEDLPKTGIPKIVSSFMAGQKETSAMQRYADLLIPKLMGTRTLSEEEEEELSTLDASLDDVDNKDAALKGIGNLAQFFIGPFSKASRNLIPMTLIGGAATAMMSRTQGSGEMLQPVASALATAPAAISSIAQTAFHSQAIKDGMKVESALLYRDLMNMTDENGVPLSETVGDDVMKTVALLAGGFSGAMEALPLEYFSEIIPGLKQMSSRAAFRAIMKHPKARGALVSFVKNYVIGLGVESGTEAVQRGITKTGEEIVKAYARSRGAEVNNDTLKEWAQDLGQEFVGALESFSLAMIPAPGMRYVSDLHRVRQAEQQQQMFVNIAESVSGSKLKDRAPDALREFVSQALDGTDYASTYVDAEALVTYFQDQGVPLEEGASLIGTTAEEVRTAVETSGKVELSTGDWAAKVAGTPLGEALMEDITFDPEVPTLREKAVEEKELVEIRRRDIERAEQMLAEDKALQEEIDYVGDNVRSMGLAAGIDPSEVDQTASIMQARAKTVMGRYGIKPKEWFDAMGLEIRSETGDLVTAGGITYGQDGNIQINDAFREWFGDSQVVDENGEPLVVYHGTPNSFNEFDLSRGGEFWDGEFGNARRISEMGAFFTGDKGAATSWVQKMGSPKAQSNVVEAYLSIRNPYEYVPGEYIENLPSRLEVIREKAEEGVFGDFDFDQYSWDLNNKIERGIDPAEILLFEILEAGGAKNLKAEMKRAGYDGVILRDSRDGDFGTQYIAFDPTQIKSIHNEGTWSGETGNIYKQDKKNLIAYHNLTAQKLLDAEEIGGMPMPSMAVTDKEIPFDKYGEITLIGNRTMVDPSESTNRVYNADIYSPRIPAREWRLRKPAKARDKLIEIFNTVPREDSWAWSSEIYEIENAFDRGLDEVLRKADRSYTLRYAWLKEQGKAPAVPKRDNGDVDGYALGEAMDEVSSKQDYLDWVRRTFAEFYDEPFLRIGRKKVPYNAENALKLMRKEMLKGGENGMTFGPGAARAMGAKEFGSIEEMHEASSSLVTQEEMDEWSSNDEKRKAYQELILPFYSFSDTWEALDDSMRAIGTYLAGKGKRSLKSALKGRDFVNVSDEALAAAQAFADSIKNAPTQYFEAKNDRVVRIGDFSGAVIPSDASDSVREILERNGVEIREYDREVKGDRQMAVAEFHGKQNVLFQQTQGQVAFADGQSIISLFESADRSTLIHETGHLFLNDLRNLAQVNDKAREDLQSFYEWLDIDDWDSLTDEARTAAHEKFARTFEGYLMTGEAPSDGLRRVFATFRNWLVAIYRDLTGLSRAAGEEIELSDEVKDLFDRLLATDDEIEQARALAGYDTAVEATAESLALHREADDDAKAELGKSDAKALSKRRKDLTKQVRKELSESRGYRALSDMKKSKSKGGIKINDDEIVERYGDDYLIRVIVPLGISSRSSTWGLEDIATMYGYTSGDEMIQEIVSLPPLAEAVKARVDVQMKLEATPEQGSGQGELRNEKRLEALSEEREALLGGMEELNEDDAPDWLALMDKIEAEKEDPLSRDNVVKKIKDLGGIKYDSVVSEWGQSEASDLRKRTGAGILRKQGLSFDTMAQELRDAGMPIGTDQDLYNLLMSRPEKTKPVDVAVDSESLPWLVWILGYEGAGKYLRRRRRSVQKEQKANQESFDADREAGKDVEELRQAIVDAQVEIDYIKRALKVLDSKKQKVQKTDDDFVVDFNPSTFETTEGKVDWQQTTVVEAIEQQGTSPATMQDAWTLASRISRIAHAEGIKEGRKRASEARKKIRDKVRAANEERINWKKNVAARKQARVEVAKNVARKTIEGKKISEIKPSMYIAAEKKAKRAVEKALKDNNFDEATRQKDIQIVNAALAMEATQARKIAAKIERYLKKKAKQRKPGSMDVAYLDKIHSLLDGLYFGVRKAKQESEIAGFLEWKKQKEDEGEIVVVPDRLLSKMGKTHWQDLTFAELVELGDSVKNLEHLGRMKNSLMLKHRQKEFDEVVDLFVKSVRKNVGVKHPQNLNPNQHMADKALSGLRGLAAMHKRMEFLLRYLDGEKDMGIAWDIFFRPFVDAQNAETVLKESSARDMAEIFSLIDVKHMMKERYYPSVGMSLSKENILSMALNWGAEGNRQRLLDGHNLTEDQVMELFRELTESDWAFVQAVWDYTASFRPEIAELEKEMTGVEPNWVEPAPFVTPSGITMRGGYHHIKYDPTKNIQAFEFEEKKKVEDFMSVQAYRAQTRHGFTKARASEVHGRPLDLHLSVISEHINEVIHDLTHRRAVRDVAKLLDDKRVQKAIAEAVGPEMWREFKPWLKNIASVGTHEPLNWWEKVMSRARKGVTVGVLGLKLTTSMMQVMSIFGASERIGQAGMLKSILSFYHNPAKWKAKAQFVFDRSPEVRNRRNTWDRDVKYVVESQVGRGKKGRITAAMFYTHGLVDAAAVIPVWLEAYDQKLAETGNEQKAIYYADSVIRQTQPASNPKDLPSVMRGHPSRKLFTMFYSYFSVLNNLFASRFHTTKGVKDLPRLVGSFIWLVFVPAVLGQIATGRGPDDDDDWAEWMLSQTLLYPTQTLIGVRDVVSAMAHPEFGYKMSPAVNAFESVIRLSVQAKQAIVDDDDWDDVLEPALEVAGYWGQFPVLQTKITLGQLILYMAGEESDWDISQLFVKKRR